MKGLLILTEEELQRIIDRAVKAKLTELGVAEVRHYGKLTDELEKRNG